MAHGVVVEALKVSLDEGCFCVATGPHDSAVAYPCPVEAFAPVLLGSPVTLHVYCPALFPDRVLRVHAEHLGHFTGMRNVPRVDPEQERALFSGLCGLFGTERVLGLYREALSVGDGGEGAPSQDGGAIEKPPMSDGELCPSVFVKFRRENTREARRIASLASQLTGLFDVEDLREKAIPHVKGEEPAHMLFLFLVQLMAVFLSSCLDEASLATLMSVALSPFLEGNFCDPLCAATLLKPMFIPWFEAFPRKADGPEAKADPEAKLKYYRLYKGYEITNEGADVSSVLEDDLTWTSASLQLRTLGYKIEESLSKTLWFVAPQFGDRLRMTRDSCIGKMAVSPGEHVDLIRSCLLCDNVMAYVQCALFGTIRNMLPCHANSEFCETVMAALNGSMRRFAAEARHQSRELFSRLEGWSGPCAGNCLYTSGVSFAGQSEGRSLFFGKIFTGPEDRKPPGKYKTAFGDFSSVTLGLSLKTGLLEALRVALERDEAPKAGCGLRREAGGRMQKMLSTAQEPVCAERVVTEVAFFARYHHRFNSGEFTEVGCVKAMSEPGFNEQIHKDVLDDKSEYRLSLAHGALPMCALTLSMTMRQTVMMTLGFFCVELAHGAYAGAKLNYSTLCSRLVSLSTVAKFRHGKDSDNTNVFQALYGNCLKLTCAMFSKPNPHAPINYHDLDLVEWLHPDNPRLPCYLRKSLAMIGGTKARVRDIMRQHGLCYNRVMFSDGQRRLLFSHAFANADCLIHAPVTICSSLRLFSNTQKSFGSLKACRWGCYYRVTIMSNGCVNTALYTNRGYGGFDSIASQGSATGDEVLERIKQEVSRVLPRIDVGRIRMMAPEMKETEFAALVSAVKDSNIEVTGQMDGDAELEPWQEDGAGEENAKRPLDHSDADDAKRGRWDACETGRVSEDEEFFFL
uniref:Uncharacterized protein n=1 Tax=Oryzias latipes TaxID=8090 RepID=A0A286P9T1_ORYLA|nr:hypothetical protein [Oryzias latipes]